MEFSTDAIERYIEHAEWVLDKISDVNDIDPQKDPQAWIDAYTYIYHEMPPRSQLDSMHDQVAIEISKGIFGWNDGDVPRKYHEAIESTGKNAGWMARYRQAQGVFGDNFDGLESELRASGKKLRLVSELIDSEEFINGDIEFLKYTKREIEEASKEGKPKLA